MHGHVTMVMRVSMCHDLGQKNLFRGLSNCGLCVCATVLAEHYPKISY